MPKNVDAPKDCMTNDPILFWNCVALEANKKSHSNGKNEQTGPTLSSRALAIVHLAMYDAFVGSDQSAQLVRYDATPAAPAEPLSSEAAIAGAAHTTLSALFPSQRKEFNTQLATVADRSDPGFQFGKDVARRILQKRIFDPDTSDGGYEPPEGRGQHRVDPDNPIQGYHGPNYGSAALFAATNRHTIDEPPLDDATYRAALQEVRAKGIAPELMGTLPPDSDVRTPEETVIGIFWGYDGRTDLGTPPRLYNQIVRKIAIARKNSVAENARLFALVNVAMADAGILAWAEKYRYNFWRPVLGIREEDQSTGPSATVAASALDSNCDMLWLPLGAPHSNGIGKNFTPPFPAYPSGHATFGAAAFHMTRLFYDESLMGDRGPDTLLEGMSFVSDEFDGITTDNRGTIRSRHLRSFPGGLWQMIELNGFSRVYLGVHWHFDAFAYDKNGAPDYTQMIGGVPLGVAIAEDIFEHRLTNIEISAS